MKRKLLSVLIASLFTAGLAGVAYGTDSLPGQPKSEQPGTGNEPAGITTGERIGMTEERDGKLSKSEYEAGQAGGAPMSRTTDEVDRDFGEEVS